MTHKKDCDIRTYLFLRYIKICLKVAVTFYFNVDEIAKGYLQFPNFKLKISELLQEFPKHNSS